MEAHIQTSNSYGAAALSRAIVLIVPGLFITFSPGHTGQFGLVALGVTGLVLAAVQGGLAWRVLGDHPARGFYFFQALVSLVIGALALGLNSYGIGLLLWAVVVWALLMGASEILAGLRLPKRDVLRRDWVTQGTLTVLFALVVLTQSADSVAVVGFFGAWAIVMGVYLVIAAITHHSMNKAMNEKVSL